MRSLYQVTMIIMIHRYLSVTNHFTVFVTAMILILQATIILFNHDYNRLCNMSPVTLGCIISLIARIRQQDKFTAQQNKMAMPISPEDFTIEAGVEPDGQQDSPKPATPKSSRRSRRSKQSQGTRSKQLGSPPKELPTPQWVHYSSQSKTPGFGVSGVHMQRCWIWDLQQWILVKLLEILSPIQDMLFA